MGGEGEKIWHEERIGRGKNEREREGESNIIFRQIKITSHQIKYKQ